MRGIKIFLKIVLFIGLCYSCLLGFLYLNQDAMMFFPIKRGNYAEKMHQNFPKWKEVSYYLPTGEQLYGWYRPAQKGKKTVVFFHGNGACAEVHAYHLKKLYKEGYGLMLPEYRGYGNIKGKPSQKTMEEDALTAIKYLKGLDIQNKDIVIYGHSMGTYLAVYTSSQLGAEKPFNGVILESPFLSAVSIAQEEFGLIAPVKLLMKNPFLSDDYIQKINTRLLLGHGKEDDVIPYEQGWQLYQLAKEPKVFYRADKANHLNLVEHGFDEAIVNWIEKKEITQK